MRYNVAQLMKEPVGVTRSYELDEEGQRLEEEWGQLHLVGTVQMLRTQRGVLVTAALRTAIPAQCSRCLEEFAEPLELAIEEEYFPLTDVFTGAPLEVLEDAGTFTISARHILDLLEAVRQAILLSEPIQPLCRQDCPGLCLVCGRRLGPEHSGCQEKEADPRWEQLRRRLG
ncbi:MAG: DUF177 domain-containing protein [Chloroflexi bacterium]|nr:DUF177 domain-containing protein [Chloroflexota bacterium]